MTKLTGPQALGAHHVIDAFVSGESAMDDWLQKKALAAAVNRTANAFVLCRGIAVVGYYSLATAAVAHGEANAKLRRNAPDPVPAILLARVAVSLDEKGQGLGRALVNDAMRRTMFAGRHVAARTLLVHALNERAAQFYRRLGFLELPNPRGLEAIPMHLPLETIEIALKRSLLPRL